MENQPTGKKSFINPYQLLNVKPSSSIKELKKAYRDLALICHPDKNGSREDMIMIQNAYEYVRKEIEFGKNKQSFEEAEDQFKAFCDAQTQCDKPYPDLVDIIHDQVEYTKRFNEAFEEIRNNEEKDFIMPMTYESHYGDMMVNDGNRDDELKPLEEKQQFKRELVIYKEPIPAFINGLSSEFDFKMKDCKDFTNYNTTGGDIFGVDYQMAFSQVSSEDFENNKNFEKELLDKKEKQNRELLRLFNDTQNQNENRVGLQYLDIKQSDTSEEADEKAKEEFKRLHDELLKQRAEVDNMFRDLENSNEETVLDRILNLRKEEELKRMTGENAEKDDVLFIEKTI